MSETVIYGKAGCPYTDRARQAHANHVYYDVKQDPARLREMLALSGGRREVPVIVQDGKVGIGCGGT